jgi:putative hydrolase of the HAD superfamily
LAAGAWGVHVPHALTWALEHAEAPKQAARFRTISDLGALPHLIQGL